MKRFLLPAMALLAIASLVTAQCAVLPVATAGGNGQSGYMFDIENISANPITVTGLTVVGNGNVTTTLSLFTLNVTGSFTALAANTTTAANWTVQGAGPATLTTGVSFALPFPIAITIAPATKQAVYITTTVTPATYVSYTTGAAGTYGTAVIATDGVLNVYAGCGKAQAAGGLPFGGTFGGPTVGVSASRNYRGAITYQTGALPSFEVNSPESSLDFNGANGTACSKAVTTLCAGGLVTATLSTNLPTVFDVAFNLSPTVANGAGALATAGGQLVNLDFMGGLFFLNGAFLPHPGVMPIPLAAPPVTISAQQIVFDPTHVDGINLSQAAQLVGLAATTLTLANADDATYLVNLGASPLCSTNSVPFYGTVYTQMHVTTNGLVCPGAVGTTAWVPTAAAAMAGAGKVGVWSDWQSNLGATASIVVNANGLFGGVDVTYTNMPYWGTAVTSSFNVGIDSVGPRIEGLTGLGTDVTPTGIVLSQGVGATDPLANAAFSLGGTGTTVAATDMIYNIGTGSPALGGGANNIWFTFNLGGGVTWNGL